MARRGYGSDVSIDRYADRDDRTHISRGGGRRHDDRYYEEDHYRRGPPTRERERETRVREEVIERERPGPPPAFLQEGYGRTTAGPVVLRKRETEDFEFAPRRRSPSPEPERTREREEIIIRRDESEQRPPPRRREPSREREEIIIRRDERESRDTLAPSRRDEREREEIVIRREEGDRSRDPRGPPGGDREREEIIIRRDDRDRSRDTRGPPGGDREREEIIKRRDEVDRDRGYGPPGGDREREEIIIRRDERKDDDVMSRRGGGGDREREEIIIRRDEDDRRGRGDLDKYALTRPISHERERSRHRGGSESDTEVVIRRDKGGGRHGNREREEIIINHRSRSNSPSSVTTSSRYPPPAPYPPASYGPPMTQREDAISRAIDRDYEITLTPRRPMPTSRPPSPPSPPREPARPPVRERSAERIAIHRSGERNGRDYHEDIVIDRNDTRSRSPLPPPARDRDPLYDGRRPGPDAGALVPHRGYDNNIEEEAEYYNDVAKQRGYIGEANHGATRDWSLVDIPPGTRRVRMDGAGGGEQEITWQRYNGVRRSKFYPDGDPGDAYAEPYGNEVGRPAPYYDPRAGGHMGASYGKPRDPRDGLWTEVTKDLVVKEAIKEMGYEFEETDDFYYIFKYLSYVSIRPLGEATTC